MTSNDAGNERVRHAQGQLDKAKAEKRRDPESEFYDSVKKKRVVVELQSGKTVEGTLAWVSTYSIGVTQNFCSMADALAAGHHKIPNSVTVTKLIMKGSIATLREAV